MEKIRILHLEDNPVDAELCFETLKENGIDCDIRRVETESDFVKALESRGIDLIISDFSLPRFNGRRALAFAAGNYPDIPFIFLSGTIGEDAAIESMVDGATDYVLKHKFARLAPAIKRAIRESAERRSRHEAQRAIRESEEKYRRIFEESRDAIFIRTPEGRFLDINPAGLEMLGYAGKSEVLSLDVPEGLYRERSKWTELQNTIKRQGYVRNFELSLKRKDGTPVIVLETISAGRNNQDAVAHHGIWHDITEHRKLEAQFLRVQRLDSIGRLSSGVAHDLNNILSPILMGVELLRERASDPSFQPILDTIQKSGQRGADLTRQILAFARGVTDECIPVQLRTLVSDVQKVMQATLLKSIAVNTDVQKDLWVVMANGTQMHQVLMNLCVNARDAMPSGGILTISARNLKLTDSLERWGLGIGPGSYVALQVSDTGHGIPQEILDKIFEPFFTTKEVGKGTGLGLSTVQSIAKNHGGLVDINSTVGRGTVITVYIAAHEVSNAGIVKERESISSGNGELILIVDDESAVRDIVRATLEAFGYRALTASDGAEALGVFAQNNRGIKAIITDVNMPIMDGRTLVQALERIDRNVRVICASGSSPGIGGDLPPQSGVVRGYLQKPFTTEELLRALAEVLRAE